MSEAGGQDTGARHEGVAIAVALAVAAFFAFIPGYMLPDRVDPCWHWQVYDLPWVADWRLLPCAVALGLAAWLARTRPLAAIMLAHVVVAFALRLLLGHGFPGQLITTYITDAFAHESVWKVFAHYDEAIQDSFYRIYTETKPPGRLLVFVGLHRLVGLVARDVAEQWQMMAFLWHIVLSTASCGILFGVHRIVRQFRDEQSALFATLLLAASPSMLLLCHEFSTRLYPLAALGLWWMCKDGLTTRVALACGALWALLFYTSFETALLLFIPLLSGLRNLREDPLTCLTNLMWLCLPPLLFYGLLWVVFDYSHLHRMEVAVFIHEAHYDMHTIPFDVMMALMWWRFGEVAMGAGPALVVAFLWGLDKKPPRVLLPLLLLILIAPMTGRVVAESGRLWAFMFPIFAIGAGFMQPSRRAAIILVGAQLGLVAAYLPLQFYTHGKLYP